MDEPEKEKSDPLSDIFNLPSLTRENKVVVVENNPEKDYEYTRTNMIELIELAIGTAKNAIDIADQSQHPRNYEVANQLINTAGDLQKKFLELRKLKQDTTGETGPQTVNQTLIVSSSEMLDRIKAAQRLQKNNGED